MTRLLAQTLDNAISKGVSGITRRWSMVPCSRSRTTAAPARMIASMVILLMTPITLVNQAVVRLGLNSIRITRFTGEGGTRSACDTKSAISVLMIGWG